MYDVNPLGPMMHLKELERQAAPKDRPVRYTRQGTFRGAAVGAAVNVLMRRFLRLAFIGA
jgi:hypothetical protein